MDKEVQRQMDDSYTYHFFFNHGIFDELMHYQDLIKETELFLKTKIVTFESSLEEEITDERFGKKMQYQGIFPSVLWKSLFLSSYFLLENSMDQICKNLRKSNSFTLSLKDISGNGIFRSSLYLKKVCNVLEPFQTEIWTEIINFNRIRNVLVHADGIIPKSSVDSLEVCEKYSQIGILNYDEDNLRISIDSEFCKYSLAKIENILQKIYQDMQKLRVSH